MTTEEASSQFDTRGGAVRQPPVESVGASDVDAALAAVSLIGWARARVRLGRPSAGAITRLVSAAFACVAIAWPVAAGVHPVTVAVLALVVTQALAASVEFEIGPGYGIPTSAVMGAAILTVPAALIPGSVFAGLALAALVAGQRDAGRRESVVALAMSSWHGVGPAVVVAVAPMTGTVASMIATAVAALAAQIVVDFCAAWVRNCIDSGVPARAIVNSFRFTTKVDVLLFPLGILAARAADERWFSPVLVLPVIALLALLQRDRTRYLDHALALQEAFRVSANEARTDALTGLDNRTGWQEAVSRLSASSAPIVVLFADVDGLKRANDSLGHEIGDRLIVAVARAIAAACPPDGRAARLGGDEFGLLASVPNGADPSELADELAARVRQGLCDAEPIDGNISVEASIGAAVAVAGDQLSDAMALADQRVNDEKVRRGARRA